MVIGKGKVVRWQKRESEEEKMKKKCHHCVLRGHTKEECFKLVGYPEWFDKQRIKGKEVKNISQNKQNNNKVGLNASKNGNDAAQEIPREDGTDHASTSSRIDVSMISNMVQ